MIQSARFQQVGFLLRRSDEGNIVVFRIEHHPWMRIKRQEHAFPIHFTREFRYTFEQGSMTVMHAIKRADGDHCISQWTNAMNVVMNLHKEIYLAGKGIGLA